MSPDTRHHRGAHPSDAALFAPENRPLLRSAAADYAWLLTRGYAATAALKLVGDRYRLRRRQRTALSRVACSDQKLDARRSACLPLHKVAGDDLIVDGFNVLILLESALSGGVVLRGRDGCLRDLASVHGTYRAVQETSAAIRLVGETVQQYGPRRVRWLFDKPVSNSGRLAAAVREEAEGRDWPWAVDVVMNPDAAIMASDHIAVTSDSAVLDGVARWANLTAEIVSQRLPCAWILDLTGDAG